MKFTLTALFAAVMAGSMVSAAVVVEPTRAALDKRQTIPTDPAQLSAILENPQSALGLVSSLISIPAVSSAIRSIATNSAYEAEISRELVSAYGTVTGEQQLSSYKAVIGGLLGETAQATATSTSANVQTTGSSGNAGATSGTGASGTNGAGMLSVGAMSAAMVAGAAVVMAAL